MAFRRARSVLVLAACLAVLGACAAPSPAPGPPAPTVTDAPTPTPSPSGPPHLPTVVNHGLRTGSAVALTFDADMTPAMRDRLHAGRVHSYANTKVLDILEQRGVAATFFLTGMWVQEYPVVTTRLARDPRFELANHSWSHGSFTPSCYDLSPVPPAQMAEELRRTFEVIAPYGGNQTRYFRFPGLCYNAAALAAIAPLDVTVIQGDVVSGDPKATAWQPIAKAVLDHVQPGSIIVMHITEDNAPMTDEALPTILDGLAAKGLHPVRLSELLTPAP